MSLVCALFTRVCCVVDSRSTDMNDVYQTARQCCLFRDGSGCLYAVIQTKSRAKVKGGNSVMY